MFIYGSGLSPDSDSARRIKELIRYLTKEVIEGEYTDGEIAAACLSMIALAVEVADLRDRPAMIHDVHKVIDNIAARLVGESVAQSAASHH
jgi:hypothetical protein